MRSMLLYGNRLCLRCTWPVLPRRKNSPRTSPSLRNRTFALLTRNSTRYWYNPWRLRIMLAIATVFKTEIQKVTKKNISCFFVSARTVRCVQICIFDCQWFVRWHSFKIWSFRNSNQVWNNVRFLCYVTRCTLANDLFWWDNMSQ